MKVLVLDNYDSFTYNLVQIVREVLRDQPDSMCDVFRNDRITPDACLEYNKIILSPGPGIPDEAGNLKDVIRICAPSVHLFGVCLGHQAIAEVFGGSLRNLDQVFHGVATDIHVIKSHVLFENLPATFSAGRYHSWVVSTNALPEELEITSTDALGQIMSMRHGTYEVHGVQFHPESILTPRGSDIIKNFLNLPL